MTPHPPDHGRVRYGVGEGIAIAGTHIVGLLAGAPDEPAVSPLVEALLGGGTFDTIIDVASSIGIMNLPDLVLVFVEGSDVRLLVRGAATARTLPSGAETSMFRAGNTKTWLETVMPACALSLRLGTTSDTASASFVLGAGSAPASIVDFDPYRTSPSLGSPPVETPIVRAPEAPTAAPYRVEMTPAAVIDPSPAIVVAIVDADVPVPAALSGHDDFDFGHLLGATMYRGVEEAAIRLDSDDATPVLADQSGAAPPLGPIVPTIEAPVTPPPLPLVVTSTIREDDPPLNFETLVHDDTDPPAPPSVPERTGSLISGVPGMTGTRAEAGERWTPPPGPPPTVTTFTPGPSAPGTPAPTTTPPAGFKTPVAPKRAPKKLPEPLGATSAPQSFAEGRQAMAPTVTSLPAPAPAPTSVAEIEPENLTVSAAVLRARRKATGQASTRATLQAAHCAESHPNPPHADLCRICGQGIQNHAVTIIARPSLGSFHFDDGQVIGLVQPLVIGRRPPDGAVVAGEPALAVRLADPDSELSRTHIEVRLADWQVQIVDRDSMNHTFVELPGLAPTQLRPAEPFPIPPGTIVRLGESTTFEYKVP